jgi:hypothetical protein
MLSAGRVASRVFAVCSYLHCPHPPILGVPIACLSRKTYLSDGCRTFWISLLFATQQNPTTRILPCTQSITRKGLHVVRERSRRTRGVEATGLVISMRVQKETGRSSSDSLGSAWNGRRKRTQRVYSLMFNCEQRELSKSVILSGSVPLTREARKVISEIATPRGLKVA